MFPIPLKAAAARRDDSCGLPMQRSCSACSLSLSSISARPSSFSAVPARGHVFAPIAGIVSTGLAHVGQSLVAGTPIAEILDPTDIFVDWYVSQEAEVAVQSMTSPRQSLDIPVRNACAASCRATPLARS